MNVMTLLTLHLNGMSSGVHAETESFVEGRLAVVTAHPSFLLNDPLLSGYIYHVEFHVHVCLKTQQQ